MNEITLSKQTVTPSVIDMAIKLGETAWGSQLFGVAKKEAATMIMLRGFELGFPLTASFEYLQVIDGKMSLKPLGALALANMHPEIIKTVEVTELTDEKGKFTGARCMVERQDGRKMEASFTLEDAKTAGLVKVGGNWEKYPKNMCRWRAVGFALDLAAPELLGGLTLGMKIGEALPEDDLDMKVEQTPTPVIETTFAPLPAPTITLSDLTARFTADQIMSANGGKIPATNEECAAIYTKLEGAA